MAIKGAERMSHEELAHLIDRGARVIVFSYCVSALIITFRRSATVLVHPGQSVVSAGLPYTALSLVAGWWGFPFGLIFTPIAILTNLGGGKDVTAQVRATVGPQIAGPSAPLALPGRSVLVPWSDGKAYPATVLASREGQLHLRFGNGHEQWVPANQVRPA